MGSGLATLLLSRLELSYSYVQDHEMTSEIALTKACEGVKECEPS